MDGDGFVGPFYRSIKARLASHNEGSVLRKRHGIYGVARLIDAHQKEIPQRNSPPQFKIMAVVVKILKTSKNDIESATKNQCVIDATKKVASVLNLLARQANTYRKTYQSCMMDSTDYNNVKYIGERIDMDSTIKLAEQELPSHSHEDLSSDEDILGTFWGTNESILKKARCYLRGQTLSDSEYASDLDADDQDDQSEDMNDDNNDEEEDQKTPEPRPPARKKSPRSEEASNKDDEDDSFIVNDEEMEHEDDETEDDDEKTVSSYENDNHAKISDEMSEDEDLDADSCEEDH